MLNNRQKAVYNLLISNNGWMGMEQIINSLPQYYPRSRSAHPHDSHARRMLTADIQAINKSPDVDKVISHGNGGIKILARSEAEHYISNRYAEAIKMLNGIRAMEKKIGLDSQMDLVGRVIHSFQEV